MLLNACYVASYCCLLVILVWYLTGTASGSDTIEDVDYDADLLSDDNDNIWILIVR